LGALGGFPFALRSNIEKELQTFKNLGVGCVFVFNGLEFGKKDHLAATQPASRSYDQAWELYDQQQADRVVDAFSNAGMITTPLIGRASLWTNPPPAMTPCSPWSQQAMILGNVTDYDYREPGTPPPETLYRFLQRILKQNGVSFMVAPYSAAAQVGQTHARDLWFLDPREIHSTNQLNYYSSLTLLVVPTPSSMPCTDHPKPFCLTLKSSWFASRRNPLNLLGSPSRMPRRNSGA
jgi:hypothetical protein